METITEEQRHQTMLLQPAGAPWIPESGEPVHALERYHRYLYASRFVKGKRVLDVDCGEGYGAAFLSLNAAEVIGLNADELRLFQARQNYAEFSKARFEGGTIDSLGLSKAIDVVVAFDALERLSYEACHRMMNSVKATLKPGGIAVIASPVFPLSHSPNADDAIPRGHRFSPVDFSEFLKEYFRNALFIGQKPLTVSSIWSLYQWSDDNFRFHSRENLFTLPPGDEQFADPNTIIAICSDEALSREIANRSNSFYFDTAQVKRAEEIFAKSVNLEEEVSSLEGSLKGLRNEVAERNVTIEHLRLDLEESRRQSASLEMKVAERDSEIGTLRNDLDSAHGSLETLQQAFDLRTARANGLKEEQSVLTARFQELQRAFDERSSQLERLDGENMGLRSTVVSLEQKLAEQTSQILGGNEETQHLRLTVGSLEQQLEERSETLRIQNEELTALRDEVLGESDTMQRLQDTVATLQRELAERTDTSRLHNEEITALRAHVVGLQTVLDEKDSHVSASAEELASYKEEIRLLHEQLKEREQAASEAINNFNQLRDRAAELEQQYGGHASLVKERDEKIRNLQGHLKEMETAMHEHMHLTAAQKRDLELLQTKSAEAQKVVAEKSEAWAKMKQELEEQRIQNDTMNKEISDRVSRILLLEKQVKDQTDFLSNIQREADGNAMTVRQLRAELEKQTIAFDTYQKSQSDLQQRYSRSQIKVQELQATTAMIEQKLARVASAPAYKLLASIGFLPTEKV